VRNLEGDYKILLLCYLMLAVFWHFMGSFAIRPWWAGYDGLLSYAVVYSWNTLCL